MSIDKLNLTIYDMFDIPLLEEIGNIQEDLYRRRFYRYFCKTDYAELMWKPHKYGPEANAKIPYSKIDINPKYFSSFKSLSDYLNHLLGSGGQTPLSHFRVSRIDLKADIGNLPIDIVLSRLYAQGYRRESVSIYKGSTIYIGSNPKIRIYDKSKEIIARAKTGGKLLDWEREIVDSKKQVTRFEIQVGNPQINLQQVADDPSGLVAYFDKLEFYNFEDDGKIASLGGLQLLMMKMRRESRKAFEDFKDRNLKALIRSDFINQVNKWFGIGQSNIVDDIPF